ncbi:MAG TPA: NAD(P)-dependent alcohol dehydrogenase [Thermoanaerobaculia bacterium]
MKAFVMRGVGKVGLMEKEIPEIGPDDALVRTTAALICTSDVHTVAGAIGERHDLTLGHEAVGRIEKLGSAVQSLRVGQRVTVGAITPCWRCENCQRGYPSQCGQPLGGWKFANVKDGNLAEFFHVNDAQANLAPIPDAIPDEAAVYTCDMMSTGLVGAEHGAIPAGGTVAVFGLGPVGLMATAFARLLGAGLVIGVDCQHERHALARHFGADETIDFKTTDPVAKILRLTGGQGVDTSIEALGAPETFEGCVKVTRPGGTISNVGYHGHGDSVPIPRREWGVGMSDQVIRTGLCPGGRVRMERLLRLISSKRLDPTPLTTHRFGFAEIEKAFHLMAAKSDGIIKPLIVFPG